MKRPIRRGSGDRKLADHERQGPATDGKSVKHQHGRALRQAERDEPVRRMVAAALRGFSAPQLRSTVTNVVSKIGTKSISTGTARIVKMPANARRSG